MCLSPVSQKRRRGNRRVSAWCRAPMPTLWMWSAQNFIKTPLSLAMHKRKSCVLTVPLSSVSP
ncbi:hypothetical protein LEMLEM_LOCUS11402 [Lemmus lemmus]